jgi:hypothetical protein
LSVRSVVSDRIFGSAVRIALCLRMKTAAAAAVLFLFASSLPSQTKSPPAATPTHFRWSEYLSHELDYGHTIRTATDLTASEKKTLQQAVVERLKLANRFVPFLEDMSPQQIRRLAEDTRIELVDLNGDGTPEVIAEANGLGPCGATGNCSWWIFQRTSGGYKLLLASSDRGEVIFEKIIVRPWSTNGFRDIVLGSHSSSTARNIIWYRYSHGAYRPCSCYYLSWIGDGGVELQTPDISSMRCSGSKQAK